MYISLTKRNLKIHLLLDFQHDTTIFNSSDVFRFQSTFLTKLSFRLTLYQIACARLSDGIVGTEIKRAKRKLDARDLESGRPRVFLTTFY